MTERLTPGTDPRNVFESHRERGPSRIVFTLHDVADATQLALATVRSLLAPGHRRYGHVRGDLLELAAFVLSKLQRRGPFYPTQVVKDQFLREHKVSTQWEARYPEFTLYVCPMCDEVLLYDGMCREHGGPFHAPIRLSTKGYFEVYMGNNQYQNLHRSIKPHGPKQVTHHRDLNKLNNRTENLQVKWNRQHLVEHGRRFK